MQACYIIFFMYKEYQLCFLEKIGHLLNRCLIFLSLYSNVTNFIDIG